MSEDKLIMLRCLELPPHLVVPTTLGHGEHMGEYLMLEYAMQANANSGRR